MLKRSTIVRSIIIVLVLGSFLPAAAVTTSMSLPTTMASSPSWMMPDDAAPLLFATAPKLTCELGTDALYEPFPRAASCVDKCRELYSSCLDDCDAWPYPGCYNDCRYNVLIPCYLSCL